MTVDRGAKGAITVIRERLFYLSLPHDAAAAAAARDSPYRHCFSIDEDPRWTYWNFFNDFGPLNLSQLYRFCTLLNAKLRSERLRNKAIYYCSGNHPHQRANAVFLICAWSLLFLDRSPEEAFQPFRALHPPLQPFHDASPCACTFPLTVTDCLRGLDKARRQGFFSFAAFDADEYEHYEQVENGDLNWIVRGKILAFAGPHPSAELTAEGYRTLTPESYLPYFKKNDVRLVVRLNRKSYDEGRFLRAGIKVLDLYFVDGGVPPARLLERFLQACESCEGAIAVHCKAGLGRTGTCIGALLMKHFKFSAAEAIGWLRLCRPGSVIGPQQHYLRDLEAALWREGELFSARNSDAKAVFSGITSGTSGSASLPPPAGLPTPLYGGLAGSGAAASAAAAAGPFMAVSSPAVPAERGMAARSARAAVRRQSRERRETPAAAAAASFASAAQAAANGGGGGGGGGGSSSRRSTWGGGGHSGAAAGAGMYEIHTRTSARQAAVRALEANYRGSTSAALTEHAYGGGGGRSGRRSTGGGSGVLSQGDYLRLRRYQQTKSSAY